MADITAGFEAANFVVERSFTTRPVRQGYIEPHACLISVGADNKTTIWSSSQGQFGPRHDGVSDPHTAESALIPAEIGGGFGGKTIVYLEPLATLLAKKSGRPVKMVMTREEDAGDGADVGLQEHGEDEGRHHRRRARHLLSAGGAFRARRSAAPSAAALRPTISRTCCRKALTRSPNSKVAAYRAPGAPIGAYAVEAPCSMSSPKR